MATLAMKFGWRRVPAASGGGGPGPAAWLLAATLAGGATAAMAQLNAVPAPSEQAETTALVARMTVAPGTARRTLIDNAIAGLKADGVWAKLDWLVVTAAHDAQAARLNWRATKSLSAVNSPSFTTDRGYTGDGSTSYLDAGETLQAGGAFTKDSGTLGSWCNAAGTVDGRILIGSSTRNFLTGRASGSLVTRINSTSNTAGGTPSWTGHRAASRTGPSAIAVYLNGAVDFSGTTASANLESNNFSLLAQTGNSHTNARIAAGYVGSGLSDSEIAALHGRLNTFLTAIGAN